METAKAKCHHPDDRGAGRRAAVIMNGFGDSVAARVWAAVAKLLESGQISMIGICAICARFYIKSRDWQKCCPRQECKRNYDNILSADRKPKARAEPKAKGEGNEELSYK